MVCPGCLPVLCPNKVVGGGLLESLGPTGQVKKDGLEMGGFFLKVEVTTVQTQKMAAEG
jgi:hypothetical protein